MSGLLLHSPAGLVREVLIELGLGVEPAGANAIWPVYAHELPKTPDKLICAFDTTGRWHGRDMVTARAVAHHGIMVQVRSITSNEGYVKANAIAVAIDAVYNRTVAPKEIDGVVLSVERYLIETIIRTGDVNSMGKESPPPGATKAEIAASFRLVFSINALVSLKKLT